MTYTYLLDPGPFAVRSPLVGRSIYSLLGAATCANNTLVDTDETKQFWKNFRLGEEIDVSGAFIYNGMRRFHEMQKLDFTDEVFDFLYNLSVGFERLLKIAVVLLEHYDGFDQKKLENSLITHNHLDLLARVKKHVRYILRHHTTTSSACLGRSTSPLDMIAPLSFPFMTLNKK